MITFFISKKVVHPLDRFTDPRSLLNVAKTTQKRIEILFLNA